MIKSHKAKDECIENFTTELTFPKKCCFYFSDFD